MTFLAAAAITFLACFVVVPVVFWLLRFFGFYAVVEERTCYVYVLFGKVVAVIDEPGLHILLFKLGLKAPIVRWLGRLYVLDMRIDQQYLRSQPVNSEEGAPMGIGIWYEMFISDPVAFLFKNADPRGSLATNVSNSTVRCLSNLKLGDLLQNRHAMSQTVRAEVSPQSHEWGYKLGSVYIRKVHFRQGRGHATADRRRGFEQSCFRSGSGSRHVRDFGDSENHRQQSPYHAHSRKRRDASGTAGSSLGGRIGPAVSATPNCSTVESCEYRPGLAYADPHRLPRS